MILRSTKLSKKKESILQVIPVLNSGRLHLNLPTDLKTIPKQCLIIQNAQYMKIFFKCYKLIVFLICSSSKLNKIYLKYLL